MEVHQGPITALPRHRPFLRQVSFPTNLSPRRHCHRPMASNQFIRLGDAEVRCQLGMKLALHSG